MNLPELPAFAPAALFAAASVLAAWRILWTRRNAAMPANAPWDDVFDASGIDIGREQPLAQERAAL